MNGPISASPARLIVRVAAGIALSRTNSLIADGTALTILIRSGQAKSASSSAFFTTNAVPPQVKGPKISKIERSQQMEVQAITPASSSTEKASCAQCRNTTALLWRIAIPLGLPVDPDV